MASINELDDKAGRCPHDKITLNRLKAMAYCDECGLVFIPADKAGVRTFNQAVDGGELHYTVFIQRAYMPKRGSKAGSN